MLSIPLGNIPGYHAGRLGHAAVAVRIGEATISWGELDARSTRRAHSLLARGVSQGDMVTLALDNSVAFFEWTFAVWKLGAVPHMVSWRIPDGELGAMLELARPVAVIATDYERLAHLGALPPQWGLTEGSDDPLPEAVSPYWKAMSSGGSTGRPKIIVDHRPGVHVIGSTYLQVSEGEVVLNPGPLYHNAPFSMAHNALFKGNPLITMARFDAEETLRLIDRWGVASVNFVPTMMLRIWRLNDEVKARYDVSSLRNVWHMAAPMPAWLKKSWIGWLGAEKINEAYAGTEAVGATTINGVEWLAHEGSVGRPRNCELRVRDEAGADVPVGTVGEIWLKPTVVNKGYHYLGATQPTGQRGFESLGDYGWLDADGYLYLADRRTDLIISGGSNIFPAEVESAIMEHPAVDVAVVIGLPNDDLGASVHAIVRLRSNCKTTLNSADLLEFLRGRLVTYKLPRSIEFTDDPMRDDAGKVRRSQLREQRIDSSNEERNAAARSAAKEKS
ncbi:AMP-binding protein [Novosphingobium aquae]|uniref:AMP-binding protein n=1 Tax=Novosphingobium aquae TaxID=3133435 RepID=A0ABU8S922_9SPHN